MNEEVEHKSLVARLFELPSVETRKPSLIPVRLINPNWNLEKNSDYIFYKLFHTVLYVLSFLSLTLTWFFFQGHSDFFPVVENIHERAVIFYGFDQVFYIVIFPIILFYCIMLKTNTKLVDEEVSTPFKQDISSYFSKKRVMVNITLFIVAGVFTIFVPHLIPVFFLDRFDLFDGIYFIVFFALVTALMCAGSALMLLVSVVLLRKRAQAPEKFWKDLGY